MCRIWLAIAAVVVALSSISAAEQREERELDRRQAVGYVDMGIRLIVVERDPNGRQLVPGNAQKLREVDRIEVGGIVKLYAGADGRPAAHVVRRSNNPQVWYASQAQADLIQHDGPIPSVLVQGSEGASKTVTLVMWTAWRVIEHIGRDCRGGLTAPTGPRLKIVRDEIKKFWRPSWFHYSVRDQEYTFHALPSVQMASAVQRSEEAGSPFQGKNLFWCGSDEFQDHSGLNDDIMARGRTAEAAGFDYKRLCTSTFKDSSTWRNFRASAESAKIPVNENEPDGDQRSLWHLTKLLGLESPFIPPSHWQKMKAGLTDREYRRRVLAEDVGPERQLYYAWKRFDVANDNAKLPGNLRPLPLNHVDVTARELARYGRNMTVLLGHDPGKRQHVTEVLKAFEFPSDRRRKDATGNALPALVRWFVVDEITTPECTVEAHVDHVLRRVREKYGCLDVNWTGERNDSAPGAVVRIDPHTNSGDAHPGRSVYTQWRAAGFTVFAAAYNPQTKKPTPIKVEERVDLLNTLLCNVDNERRLFVLLLEGNKPAAPELVRALETMERNEQGDAEWERKDASDLSHWPSAVAFAVWSIEKPRIDAYRNRARQEAA